MKSRPIYNTDIATLQRAIDGDKFHPGEWTVEDFKGFSEVFEDSYGSIVFVVYREESEKQLRISTMWVTPDETNRNGRAIIFLVRSAAERAAAAGYRELIFTTTYAKLANFCMKVLNFVSIGGDEYVLPVTKEGSDVRTE